MSEQKFKRGDRVRVTRNDHRHKLATVLYSEKDSTKGELTIQFDGNPALLYFDPNDVALVEPDKETVLLRDEIDAAKKIMKHAERRLQAIAEQAEEPPPGTVLIFEEYPGKLNTAIRRPGEYGIWAMNGMVYGWPGLVAELGKHPKRSAVVKALFSFTHHIVLPSKEK